MKQEQEWKHGDAPGILRQIITTLRPTAGGRNTTGYIVSEMLESEVLPALLRPREECNQCPHYIDSLKRQGFKECPSCAAKPGSPALCESCLHNRHLISLLQESD